jgi:hypothetical protein
MIAKHRGQTWQLSMQAVPFCHARVALEPQGAENQHDQRVSLLVFVRRQRYHRTCPPFPDPLVYRRQSKVKVEPRIRGTPDLPRVGAVQGYSTTSRKSDGK